MRKRLFPDRKRNSSIPSECFHYEFCCWPQSGLAFSSTGIISELLKEELAEFMEAPKRLPLSGGRGRRVFFSSKCYPARPPSGGAVIYSTGRALPKNSLSFEVSALVHLAYESLSILGAN